MTFCALPDLVQYSTSLNWFDFFDMLENKYEIQCNCPIRTFDGGSGMDFGPLSLCSNSNIFHFRQGAVYVTAEYYPLVFILCKCTWKHSLRHKWIHKPLISLNKKHSTLKSYCPPLHPPVTTTINCNAKENTTYISFRLHKRQFSSSIRNLGNILFAVPEVKCHMLG